MNIKSLMIGSAAVLAASSAAKAADAIVMAEPEPMEYVRICDVYGAGFFYIPGTETCMHIGGYYRFQTNFASNSMDWMSRFQLNVDVRSETEWGTLRGYAEGRFDYGWSPISYVTPAAVGGAFTLGTGAYGTSTYLNQGFIELITASGTLRLGKADSPWARFLGYGTPFGPFDGQYGFANRQEISYQFNGSNGFSAIIAVLQDADVGYSPDVEGGINFAQGWGSVGVIGGYDSSTGTWGARGALRFNAPNGSFSGGLLVFYSSGIGQYHIGDPGAAGYNPFSAAAYIKGQFTATAAAALSAQYFSGTGGWEFTGGLDLTPITNFQIRPEVRYRTSNSSWAAAIRFDRKIP